MINIVDEVLEGEPLYRAVDKDGNIVLDNIRLELITPVKTAGTPLTRALFNSIKSGNDLVQKYNKPTAYKESDDYNYLKLNNIISEYEKGMRVFINLSQQYGVPFTSSIIPNFNSDEDKKGFSITSGKENLFDKDTTTKVVHTTNAGAITLTFGTPIKPTKLKLSYDASGVTPDTGGLGDKITNAVIKGTTVDGQTVTLHTELGTDVNYGNVGQITHEVSINNEHYLKSISFDVDKTNSSAGSWDLGLFEFDILEGETAYINSNLQSYLNINNLGDILIDSLIEFDKNYLLEYDGTVFKATQVA